MPAVHTPPHFHGSFRTDEVACALYGEGAGIFRVVPQAVAVPRDLDDLVALVRWARETGTPLVPRGAGSGMAGGNVGPGVVVDLTQGFASAPIVDAESRTARAGAAVIYRVLNEAAAPHGLVLPPDPASGKFCTLGGMVGTNAAGPHTLKHGAMRRWVRGLEFVTADGEVGEAGTEAQGHGGTGAELRFRRDVAPDLLRDASALAAAEPHTSKNSSGYALADFARSGDVAQLLVGSEGTLAFVTSVEVALAPLAQRTATLLVALRALDDVGPAVVALLPHGPSALELMDRSYLDFVQASAHRSLPPATEAVLLVEFADDDGSDTAGAMDAVRGWAAAIERADDPAAVERLWELRHLASPILTRMPDETRSLQLVEDGCVPVHRLGEYMVKVAGRALQDADVVVFLGDLSGPPGPEDRLCAELLREKAGGPLLLALNKADVVADVDAAMQPYLELFRGAAGQPLYEQAIALSALHGQGREDLLQAIIARLPEHPPYYPEDELTDQPVRAIAAELIREQVLRFTRQEVPHAVTVTVEEFKERSAEMTYIAATIHVERETQKKILLGQGGQMIKQIGQAGRQALEAFLGTRVYLDLWVKVRKNWRKDRNALRWLGYDLDRV